MAWKAIPTKPKPPRIKVMVFTLSNTLRVFVCAVLIKLAVLTLLWFVFIRDAKVAVDAAAAAKQMGAAVPTQGASK